MTRDALEHLLRAAAALTNERDFVIIGSQAVLGAFVRVLLQADLVAPAMLDRRLRQLPLPAERIEGLLASLRNLQNV